MNGTCKMFWIYYVGFFAVCLAAVNGQVAKSKFSCRGRTTGYYADVESGCRVYHMCDGLGRQFSYTCPNATLFQQRMLICDHWYMVNCSKSEQDYNANLRIGHKMPFVDDNESNPYHRTPRPDLLSHPSETEYDIIYRTGKAQFNNDLNLVGAETDRQRNNNGSTSATEEPTYNPPSHWSTQFSQQATTIKSVISNEKPSVFNNKKQFDSAGTIKGKPIISNVFNTVTETPNVNFKSSFKATTPVFPKTVEPTTVAPDSLGILPPIPYQLKQETANKFESPSSPKENVVVNFESNFKATTPVYPQSVESTSVQPNDLGILPPHTINENLEKTSVQNENSASFSIPELVLDFLPPKTSNNAPVKSNFSASEQNIEPPSKFYQPPKFEPDYPELIRQRSEKSDQQTGNNVIKSVFKPMSTEQLRDLRKKLLIPDYEFPLESASRPSYDSVLSSFQVKSDSEKEK